MPDTTPAAQTAHRLLQAALAAADPYRAITQAVRVEGDTLHCAGRTIDLCDYERVVVVGAGKATARMAQAIEHLLGARISGGLIIVKDGHTLPLRTIEQAEASHPLPDERGVAATQHMLELVRGCDARTLVLFLFSGGGSALCVAPREGLTLHDKQQVTAALMHAGADIDALNRVRKRLSVVKGGKLAAAAPQATRLTLLLSDVIGDAPELIASGPTFPDAGSDTDALAIIECYGVQDKLPPRLMAHLRHQVTVMREEATPAAEWHAIVASNRLALQAAREAAEALGWPATIVDAAVQGEAVEVAQSLARLADSTLNEMQPGERRCLLFGGETTVTVRGEGRGGRNQELALAFACEIEGQSGITLLAAGTDGSDGPTDAAGACVDGDTIIRVRACGLDVHAALAHNDSYGFFTALDAQAGTRYHLKTGPTGTNVMDVMLLLLEK